MKLDEVLENLKKNIKFKDDTNINDTILVGMKSGLFFGIVQEIESNVKKGWWDVSFKLLVMPPIDVTWTLRTSQMTGEIFTIDSEEQFVISIDTQRTKKRSLKKRALKKKPIKKGKLTLVKS
jgi:hypothetical protein